MLWAVAQTWSDFIRQYEDTKPVLVQFCISWESILTAKVVVIVPLAPGTAHLVIHLLLSNAQDTRHTISEVVISYHTQMV